MWESGVLKITPPKIFFPVKENTCINKFPVKNVKCPWRVKSAGHSHVTLIRLLSPCSFAGYQGCWLNGHFYSSQSSPRTKNIWALRHFITNIWLKCCPARFALMQKYPWSLAGGREEKADEVDSYTREMFGYTCIFYTW